jgi:transcriptional regulator with XRE-family HTH domain
VVKKRKVAGPPAREPTDFQRRLLQARLEKGWNQSQLARQASLHLGRNFGRDNVSKYEMGITTPTPLMLNALAKALGIPPEDLTVSGRLLSAEMEHEPKISMRTTQGGRAWIRINQEVPLATALAILDLLKERPHGAPVSP